MRAHALRFTAIFSLFGIAVVQQAAAERPTDHSNPVPPAVAEAIRWLPADTETIVTAQSFSIREDAGLGPASAEDESELSDLAQGFFQEIVLPPFLTFPDGALRKQLAGRTVAWAIHGARNSSVVSAFGARRYEGAHILVFESELGKSGEAIIEALRRGAAAVKKLGPHEVYAFNWKFPKEPGFSSEPWEGAFVVVPEPHILILATSEDYLRAVLERREQDLTEQVAIPASFWKRQYVDFRAPVWSIRHLKTCGHRRASAVSGSVLTVKPDQGDTMRIVYLPREADGEKADGEKSVERLVQQRWSDDALNQAEAPAEGRLHPTIQQDAEGAIVVTIPLSQKGQLRQFTLMLRLFLTLVDDFALTGGGD